MRPTPNIALKVVIVRANLLNREVAERARIHPARFSGIVRGRIVPSEGEQQRIADALGKTVAELFGSTVPDEVDADQLGLPMRRSTDRVAEAS